MMIILAATTKLDFCKGHFCHILYPSCLDGRSLVYDILQAVGIYQEVIHPHAQNKDVLRSNFHM